MCNSCASGRGGHGSTTPSSPSSYQYQQQHTGGYQYKQGYQTLRPPPLNTGLSSIGHSMNRTSSHGSSDSGYATRTPSVASPILQQSYSIQSHPVQSYSAQSYPVQSYSAQSYPVQSYPVQSYSAQSYPAQSYPAQSYVPSRQPSQQSANYYDGNQRSPDIEVVRAAPVSSSKHKKERRLSNPSPSSPSEYPCLHPGCGHISSRAHDLKRHMTVHFPPPVDELLNCKYKWCGRTGVNGFKREDHRKEHYRKVHMKDIEYPKTGKGGKSGRRSKP